MEHIKKRYCSRAYWNNCIDSIVSSINEDKDTIIDMLMYGSLENAEIIMKLSPNKAPSYELKVDKIAERLPFEDYVDE